MAKTNEIAIVNNYKLLKKKEGFLLRGDLSPEEINKFKEVFDRKIISIDCHMKIGTKIFYTKHKGSTYNKQHSEDNVLKNIISILLECIKSENPIDKAIDSNGNPIQDRYVIGQIYKLGEKQIKYRYVVAVNKERIKIISIHRNK